MASKYADRIAELATAASDARERIVDGPERIVDGPERIVDDSERVDDDPSQSRILDDASGAGTIRIGGTKASDPEEAALIAARDGLGSVVALYVEARTANDRVRFSERELKRLHAATNDWLAVYAACRGVDVDPDVTVREAAEVLIDTHDITDVAALLTGLHRA